MKKHFIVFVLILLSSTIYSQNQKTIYVNESFTEISFSEYEKKLKSKLFDSTKTVNDTAIFFKLRYKEYFGTLDAEKKKQLSRLFSKRYKTDSTKTLLIHYIDSLPNKKEMPKVSGVIVYDTLDSSKEIFLTKKEFKYNSSSKYRANKHKHVSNYTDYLKSIAKEKKRIRKKFDFLHIYDFNKGIPLDDLNENKYYKDVVPIFKKVFSDGTINYKTIILYPNGNFYLSHYNNLWKEKELLKRRHFKKKKKKWLKLHLKLKNASQ